MSNRDVITLLAAANPVRGDELWLPDPNLVDRIVARRRRPSRRIALVGATALVVLAATLVAVFATGGRQPSPSLGSMEPGIGSMDTLFSPTVARPLPGAEVTLADASAAIGQPIVLPDTSLVSPADTGSAWVNGTFPNVTAAVAFPSRGMFIEYTTPPPLADMSATYQAIARENPHSFETVDLNGGTALAVKQNSDDTGRNFGAVVFVLNGVEIGVFGHYDEGPLQSAAQSIVDQESASSETLGIGSPPTLVHPLGGGKLVTLADAAHAFGGELVQSETAVVSPSDAGAVWLAGSPQVTSVAVTYPRAHVWVHFTWPASYDGGYDDQLLRYHAYGSRITQTPLLDGVPAQVVFHSWKQPRWAGFYPSVHFDAGGVNVAIWGHQDKTTLEAIARSIVDRSESAPAGQLGNVAGVQVYPYLGHGKQISLSEASATLGSPVVLPDSPLAPTNGAQAWAEGTCPHPAATPATTEVCAVWISFPGSNLSVGYIRPPAYLGTGPEWRLQARGLRSHGSAVHLDGVPALSIHRRPGAGYPGRVEFDLGGTRVVVIGDYSPARLQEVARSIVDRSRS
jgi:hypothetical protein